MFMIHFYSFLRIVVFIDRVGTRNILRDLAEVA